MKSHKLADIFPMMSDDELSGLRANMRANGYRDEFPVWLYEGAILDGRNRWRAAIAEGVKPMTREYKGADPLAFVISANKERRHLTSSQLAFVALELERVLSDAAKERQRLSDGRGKKGFQRIENLIECGDCHNKKPKWKPADNPPDEREFIQCEYCGYVTLKPGQPEKPIHAAKNTSFHLIVWKDFKPLDSLGFNKR